MKASLVYTAILVSLCSLPTAADVKLPVCGPIVSVEPPTTTDSIRVGTTDQWGATTITFGRVQAPGGPMSYFEKHLLFLKLMVEKSVVCVDYCERDTEACYLKITSISN